MDPFLWSAISELSELGEIVDVHSLASAAGTSTLRLRSSTAATPHSGYQHPLLNSLTAERDFHSQSSRQASLSALDALTGGPRPGPTASSSATSSQLTPAVTSLSLSLSRSMLPASSSVAATALRAPFASPGAMPSPLTNSMLASSTRIYSTAPTRVVVDESPLEEPFSLRRSALSPSPSLVGHSNNNKSHLATVPERARALFVPTPSGDMSVSHCEDDPHQFSVNVSVGQALLESSPLPTAGRVVGGGDNSSSSSGDRGEEDEERVGPLVSLGQQQQQQPRRVSFGPTARLSFSAALDSHHLPQQHAADHSVSLSPIPGLSDSLALSPFPLHQTSTPHSLISTRDTPDLDGRRSMLWTDEKQLQQHQHHRQPVDSSSNTGERDSVVEVVACFARALQQLFGYYTLECIETLQSLPVRHLRSGLASQLLGRAYTEMNEYAAAVIAFREMLRLEPFRTQGLETLSAALWHLREDKDLSALAQQVSISFARTLSPSLFSYTHFLLSCQVVEVDKYCPEVWCVVGNCFSLQKEPDVANKFFQRALQIDPYFTYAHTLSGHEHVNNEDTDRAIACFRQAIFCNDRHYNAWYGLGSIYYRQERFEMSEYHFRKAREINARSSVLDCFLGTATVCPCCILCCVYRS
jgi:hypothetical protein